MLMKSCCNIIVVFNLCFPLISKASPQRVVQRVAQLDFDLKKVFKLYASPGRDTTIYFPCVVEYATGGTGEDIKLSLPKKFPNLVTVYLLHSKSESTSLKVFCSDRVFVFDVVPSVDNHIDYLKIISSYGELPRYSEHSILTTKKKPERGKATGKLIFSSQKEGSL